MLWILAVVPIGAALAEHRGAAAAHMRTADEDPEPDDFPPWVLGHAKPVRAPVFADLALLERHNAQALGKRGGSAARAPWPENICPGISCLDCLGHKWLQICTYMRERNYRIRELGEGQEAYYEQKVASSDKLGETTKEWPQTNIKLTKELGELINHVVSQGSELNQGTQMMLLSIENGLEQAPGIVPGLKKSMKTKSKSSESRLEKSEKSYEKGAEGSEKAYKKQLDGQEKSADKTTSKNEKQFERKEKTVEKDMKKMLNSNAKYLSKADREFQKAEAAVGRQEENADEFLKEQLDEVEGHTNELAETSEEMEKALGAAASLQEKGLEDEERTKEWWYADYEREQQDLRTANLKKNAENAKVLTKTVQKNMERGEETATSIARDIQVVADGGKNLQKAEEMTWKTEDTELQKLQREQAVEAHRLKRAEEKTNKVHEWNREDMENAISTLSENVKHAISSYQNSGQKQIEDARLGLEGRILSDKDRKQSRASQDSDGVLQKVEAQTDNAANRFEDEIGKTSKEMTKVEKYFDRSKSAALKEESNANAAIKEIAHMDATMGDTLTAQGTAMEKQSKELETQAVSLSEQEVNALVTQAKQALGRFQEQFDVIHKDASGLSKELQDQQAAEAEKAEDALAKMRNFVTRAFKEVQGSLQPVVDQQHVAAGLLGSAHDEMSNVVQNAMKAKLEAGTQLSEVGGQVQSAQEELEGAVQAKFSDTEQKQATASVLLTEQMGQTLQETNARIDQANKEVHDKIKGATKADAQRQQMAQKRDQQAQMELMMEENTIHKYETEFGPKYEEMLAGLQSSEKGIEDYVQAGAKYREDFGTEAVSANQGQIQAMQKAMRGDLDATVVERRSKQLLEFKDEVADERDKANADKMNTIGSIKEAIAQTKSAYKTVVGKIGKLHEQEVDVSDAKFAEATRHTMDALTASQLDHQAKLRELEDGFATGEANANAAVADFHNAEHDGRSKFEGALTDMSAGVRKTESDVKEEVDGDMAQTYRQARAQQLGVDTEARQLQNGIESDEAAVESAAARDMSHWKQVDRAAADRKRQDLAQLERVSAAMERERMSEQARQHRVERDLTDEARGAHGEVVAMQQGLGRMMEHLDPTSALKAVSDSIAGTGKLMGEAQGAEHSKAEQVEHDIKMAGDGIEKILHEAQMEDSLLSRAVMQIGMDAQQKMQKIKRDIEEESHEITGLVKDTQVMDKDLRRAADSKVLREFQELEAHLATLDKAVGLSKYQGEDAIKKVLFVLEKAASVDAGSKAGSDVLQLSTDEWRKAVETTFEGLGMALDLEKVERMAAESMAAEDATGGKLNDAKKSMEQEIAKIKQQTQNEIDYVRAQAKAAIDAIMNDESLSDEEKERRIAEIRAKADRDIQRLQMKMKQLIADQYMSAHNLDAEISGLNALIERAKLIAGADTPEAKAWVKAMMREVKSRLGQLRRRFTNEYSLVQMKTNSSAVEAKAQLAQIEHEAALLEQGGKAQPGHRQQARAAALLQAGEELSCMESERQAQQDQWASALDVLQRALPALTRRGV